jgi:hypothetical protein
MSAKVAAVTAGTVTETATGSGTALVGAESRTGGTSAGTGGAGVD